MQDKCTGLQHLNNHLFINVLYNVVEPFLLMVYGTQVFLDILSYAGGGRIVSARLELMPSNNG